VRQCGWLPDRRDAYQCGERLTGESSSLFQFFASSLNMSFSVGFKNLQQDKEFEKLYRNIQRRNTYPPHMARDMKSSYGGKARRSSTVLSGSAATRSRFPAVGGPVQPLSAVGGYASSEAGWSNVTGFRKQLNMAGSPPSNYFHSDACKIDRRAEYIGRPLTESCLGTNDTARYQSEQQSYPFDNNEEDEDGDDSTVLPSDSASQIGRGRTQAKPRGLFGEVESGRQPTACRQNPPQLQRSQTHSNVGGGTMYGAPQAFDGGRRYSVVERKPKFS
jgi:hypothetical protein